MNATSRSSAPSSPEMPTIPDAPPATIPSAAVGRSSDVVRASSAPAASEIASVAAQYERERQPAVADRVERRGVQQRAEHDARHGERAR